MKTISKCVIALLVIATLYGISWGITIGFIKLITVCFGIKFNLMYATGIWLVICFIKLMFNKNKDK